MKWDTSPLDYPWQPQSLHSPKKHTKPEQRYCRNCYHYVKQDDPRKSRICGDKDSRHYGATGDAVKKAKGNCPCYLEKRDKDGKILHKSSKAK